MAGKGIKAEEIAWSAVEDWLKGQSGPVTKDQLLEYLRANEVTVEEVTKDGGDPKLEALRRQLEEAYRRAEAAEAAADGEAEIARIEAEIDRRLEEDVDQGDVRHAAHQLPGSDNYRELLLTLPVLELVQRDPRVVAAICR